MFVECVGSVDEHVTNAGAHDRRHSLPNRLDGRLRRTVSSLARCWLAGFGSRVASLPVRFEAAKPPRTPRSPARARAVVR